MADAAVYCFCSHSICMKYGCMLAPVTLGVEDTKDMYILPLCT